MEEHFQVKISPFPSCHQIARKDHLWHNFKVIKPKDTKDKYKKLFDSLCSENATKVWKSTFQFSL